MQLGAPADCSTFGGPIEPNEGYFFQYDILYWSASAPKTTLIGSRHAADRILRPSSAGQGDPGYPLELDDTRQETSTLDTGDLNADFSVGNRIEFGDIEDRNGWLVSIYQLRNQGEVFVYSQADVVFKDPPQGPNGTQLLTGPYPDPAPTPAVRRSCSSACP